MAVINPNLASIALNAQNQQNGNPVKTLTNLNESQQNNDQRVVNNSSVTLSTAIENSSNDYLDLKLTQTTNASTAVSSPNNETSKTTESSNYAADLQAKNNYLTLQTNK